MNRRNVISGLIAATALPGGMSAVQSSETTKREAMRLLRSIPDDDAFELYLLRVAMSGDSRLRDYAVELFDSGLPLSEVQDRLHERVQQLDGGAS